MRLRGVLQSLQSAAERILFGRPRETMSKAPGKTLPVAALPSAGGLPDTARGGSRIPFKLGLVVVVASLCSGFATYLILTGLTPTDKPFHIPDDFDITKELGHAWRMIREASSRAAGSSSSFTINAGGNLTLDNSGPTVSNRLNPGAPMTLNGGTFTVLADPPVLQSMGTLTLGQGNSTVNLIGTTGGAAVNLTYSNLVRNLGATVNFVSQNLPMGGAGTNNQINFTGTVPQLSSNGNLFMPYATVSD